MIRFTLMMVFYVCVAGAALIAGSVQGNPFLLVAGFASLFVVLLLGHQIGRINRR